VPEHRAAVLHDEAAQPRILAPHLRGEQAQPVGAPGEDLALQPEQVRAEFARGDERDAVELGRGEKLDEAPQPVRQLARVADPHALVLQRDVGDPPALPAAHHDLVHGHADVGEEHLVELGAPGHGAQRPHLDPRHAHGQQQVDSPSCFGLSGSVRHSRNIMSA
jgi:hypothetical protein